MASYCYKNYNADIESSPLIDFDEDYYEEEEEEEEEEGEEEEDKALMSFGDDGCSPSHSWFNRLVYPLSPHCNARK